MGVAGRILSSSLIVLSLAAGCRSGFEEVGTGRANSGGRSGGSSGATAMGGAAGTTSGTSSTASTGGAMNEGGSSGTDAGGAPDDGGTANGGTTTTGGTGNDGGAPDGGVSGDGGSAGSGGLAGSGGSGGTTSAGSAGVGSGGTPSSGGAGSGSGGSSGGAAGSAGRANGGAAGSSSLPGCQTSVYGGKTYVVCPSQVTWDAAQSSCNSIQMNLARVNDAAENQWLRDNAQNLTPPSTGLWIGAHQTLLAGAWDWTDGTLFWLGGLLGLPQGQLYTNWKFGEPSGLLDDCGALDLSVAAGSWYSDLCTLRKAYACESR